MKLISCTTVIWALMTFSTSVQAGPASVAGAGIIPAPVKYELATGSFAVDARTEIICRRGAEAEAARFLQTGLKARTGLELKLVRPGKNLTAGIRLELVPEGTEMAEGYALEISSAGVRLRASSDAGLFYGVQSLLQMADAQGAAAGKALSLPAMNITDAPRFEWRGLMLDESR